MRAEVSLLDFNCTKGHIPVESADAIQSIFNRGGNFVDVFFGHPLNGSEVREFFEFHFSQRMPDLTIYEIIFHHQVSKSVGLIAIQHTPEIQQKFIALLLVDCQFRGMGIGSRAVDLFKSKLEPGSEYVSLKVSLADYKTLNFWKKCGFVPESELPSSINSDIFSTDVRYTRLVTDIRSHPQQLNRA